ncbi:RNA polymerase I-specific transcription initiation factor RRN6 [Spathaspora sp. JA1]|nr:RNA polymerase I-specific transcription initiation factor RRN6 [Spathaspora sp. JA1]
MWPHKKGLGIRLSYGIQGNAIIDTNVNDSTLTTSFPRQNIQSPLLTSDPITIVPPQTKPSTSTSGITSGINKYEDNYIPSNLVSSLSIESTTISSIISYDPSCVGDVVKFCNINSKPMMVHVTGEAESRVTFSSVDEVKDIYSVELGSSIRQIVCKDCLFLVRTSSGVYVLEIPDLNSLRVISEVNVKEVANLEFADVAFDETMRFAVIDIQGNFAVYDIVKKGIRKQFEIIQGVKQICDKDTTELSKWKRIAFVNNTIVTSTRSKLISYPFSTSLSKGKDIITANTWSRICDLYIHNNNIFLLTSKELIWLNNKWERLISWKHYLNDSDPSLKLYVYYNKEIFSCMLFTQTSPLIMVYTLGKINNKRTSLCDPYYVRKSGDDTRQVCVYKGKLYQINCDLSITCQNIGNTKNPSPVTTASTTTPTSTTSSSTKETFNSFTSKHIKSLTKSLTPPAPSTTEESQAIHNYAYNLGQGLAKHATTTTNSTGYFSLYDLCPSDIPIISDLFELDDMIVQLEKYQIDKVKLISVIHKLIDKPTSHINDIAQSFQDIFHDKYEQVAILLGISCIKCQYKNSSDILELDYKKKYNSMSNQVKSIFDEWEEGESEPEAQEEQTQVEIPSIHPLSQVVSASQSSQRKSQRLASQRNSQSSQPKRKKRKGF